MRQQRGVNKFVPAAVAIFFIVALGAVHVLSLDGLHGIALSVVFKPDTVFAAGYSPWKFRRVKLGMSRDEVKSLLGEPLSRADAASSDEEYWYFSTSPSGAKYHIRVVQFAHGRVTRISSEFYVD
ncbi:MAG: outer membrane protein assembly factor BamE [Archangium sp.]